MSFFLGIEHSTAKEKGYTDVSKSRFKYFLSRASTDNSELFIYNPLTFADAEFYLIFWELKVAS